jgi:hypothetical protein
LFGLKQICESGGNYEIQPPFVAVELRRRGGCGLRRGLGLIRDGATCEAAMMLVGYRNKTHFNRAFRRYLGCLPSGWRIVAPIRGLKSANPATQRMRGLT